MSEQILTNRVAVDKLPMWVYDSMDDVPEILKNLVGDGRAVIEMDNGEVYIKHWSDETPEERIALNQGRKIRYGEYRGIIEADMKKK